MDYFWHFSFFALILTCLTFLANAGSGEIPPPADVILPPALRYDPVSYQLSLQKGQSQCTSLPCRLWYDYVASIGVTDGPNQKACEILVKLSNENDFPLLPFVLIREATACAENKVNIKKAHDDILTYIKIKKPKRWIEESLWEALVKISQGTPDFIEYTLNAEKLSHSKRNRVALLQAALEQAQKFSDSRFEALEGELYRISPKYKPIPEDWWEVGVDAMNSHDYELAATAFNKITMSQDYPVVVRRTAFENLKTCYKAMQKKSDAFDAVQRLWVWDQAFLKMKKPPVEASRRALSSGLSLARFQWTEHRSHEALAHLRQMEKLLKKKVPLNDVYFMRGRINEELGDKNTALVQMQKAIENTVDLTVKSAEQWNFAWLNYKLGHYDKTKDTLESLRSVEQDPGRRSQQQFWLGKTLSKLKDEEQARFVFEQLILDDPLGIYSLLAYRELGKPIPKMKETGLSQLSKIPRKLFSMPTWSSNLFDWLVSVGEYKYAQLILDDELPIPDTGTDDAELYFSKYSAAHYFSPIFSKISKLSSEEKIKLLSEHPEYLFPQVFRVFVDEAGNKSGLWPDYIFSIMRQESGFDPLSVSGANAYGLLQVLPSVAKQLSQKTVSHYQQAADLLDPETNVTLGVQLLRQYWDEFHGQFVLTTGAYNASPETVKAWVRTRFHGDPLEFIEDIPYEETRTYIKLVLRNFIHYQIINSIGPSIPFPEWCLDGIQTFKD